MEKKGVLAIDWNLVCIPLEGFSLGPRPEFYQNSDRPDHSWENRDPGFVNRWIGLKFGL